MRFSKKNFYLSLILFSLIGQVAWVLENMYLNVFIYEMFGASPTDISIMVSASAVTAAVTTVLIGALSDKLGKRKPFICIGYIVWGVSLLMFCILKPSILEKVAGSAAGGAALGVTLAILFDCIMTFFGSSANDAAFNAWLTDAADGSNRGLAEGINSMMPLISVLVVFGSFMAFDFSKPDSWTAIFLIIGGVVLFCGVIGLFTVKDACKADRGDSYLADVLYSFRPSVVKSHPELYISLLCFSVFGISIQVFMPYLILYYTEGLKMENYVLVMAPAILLAAVVTFIFGKMYDKKGFAPSVLPSIGMLAVGYLTLFFFRRTVLVFVGSLLMMSGYLAGMACFGALLRDKIPPEKAGSFQGVRIFGQVLLPGMIGPYIGAFLLRNAEKVVNSDGTESFVPNESIFLGAFAVLILLLPLLLWLIQRLKRKASENQRVISPN